MTRPIYIAGPISYGGGIDNAVIERNLFVFRDAAKDLRALGHDVISPAEFDAPTGKTWSDFMRDGITAVCQSRLVAVLPGWECSRGACVEVGVAHNLGLPVIPIALLIDESP